MDEYFGGAPGGGLRITHHKKGGVLNIGSLEGILRWKLAASYGNGSVM
jgi:hypothetical protein